MHWRDKRDGLDDRESQSHLKIAVSQRRFSILSDTENPDITHTSRVNAVKKSNNKTSIERMEKKIFQQPQFWQGFVTFKLNFKISNKQRTLAIGLTVPRALFKFWRR